LEYLRVDGLFPAGFWAGYAHSMPLQFLAELGLAGFLPFLALILAAVVGTLRMYARTPIANRLWSRAALAGLVGFAVHSIFDDFSISPLIMTLAIFLAVWIWTAATPTLPRFRRVSLAAFALPALAMLGFSAWNLWAYAPLYQGISAAQDQEWAKAANLAEQSLRRDSNLAYYAEQAGLAWGRVWGQTRDAAALAKAQQRLQQSLAIEPNYSLLWADLGVLEWQAGKPEQAIEHMQAAARLGPYLADYPLNLGWFLEQSGRNPEALQAYRAALKLQPDWAASPFWQKSDLRKTAATQTDPPSAGETYWQQARMEIASGELQAARANLALGQINAEPADALLMTRALLAETQNQPDLAASEDKALVANLLEAYWNFPGPSDVYNLYHRRRGFPSAVVPGYLKILDFYGQAEALGKFYALQVSQGDCAQAMHTWDVWQLVRTGGQALTDAQPEPACP
jgi:tetratricopeptide (TPR) repeat protein